MTCRHLLCLICLIPGTALAQSPAPGVFDGPLTVRHVPQVALARNPAIVVARQQRGIAAAGVVLARVHPYNPILARKAMARGVSRT